jgi:beta-alanine--pyruvate transaminase
VCATSAIYDTVVNGAASGIELFHGYTYSGHPLAAAAGLATLDIYRNEGLFERAASLESYWADAVHALRGSPNVIDLRNMGIVARRARAHSRSFSSASRPGSSFDPRVTRWPFRRR